VFQIWVFPVFTPVTVDDITVLLFNWLRPVTGEFVFEDLEYSNSAFGLTVLLATDADIRFGGPGKGIAASEGNTAAVFLIDLSNSHVEVSNLSADHMGGVSLEQGFGAFFGDDSGETHFELLPEQSTFDFHHNSIQLAVDGFWSGFEMWNYTRLFDLASPNTILTNISQNTIHFSDSESHFRVYPGIFSCGVDDALVNGNKFMGQSSMAISPEFHSNFGQCGGKGWSIVGNNLNNFDASFAPIVLWPGTSNYSVVGGTNMINVADFGTDNVITGVNNMGPITPPDNLGQNVSAAQKRRGGFP
jgi:hypothetical protein